jgi:predicted RNA-binding protein (virulence factor B family)
MLKIGKKNNLEIVKSAAMGYFLNGEEYGDILLPNKFIPKGARIGEFIDVFIYYDSEDRVIATTQTPLAMVGQLAFLKTVAVTKIGAFLDWGLDKDLFVPFKEQKRKMVQNESYLVYIYVDKISNRIAASSKIDKFLSKSQPAYREEEAVQLLIIDESDVGYNVVIDNAHRGLIHRSDIFQELKPGTAMPGYIKKIREDGKIDVILAKSGYHKIEDLSRQVFLKLKSSPGYLEFSDKSSPEDIYAAFGMSKKNFKKAIGTLYKQELIHITATAITLTEKGEKF